MKWSIFLPFLAVLMSSLHVSQTDPDYDKLWREVEVLDQKGLYASAKKKVEIIKTWAKQENNSYLSRGSLRKSAAQRFLKHGSTG